MKKNLHTADRALRLLFAAAVAALAITHLPEGAPVAILGTAALVLAATAVVNFCPISYAIGTSTIKKTTSHETRN